MSTADIEARTAETLAPLRRELIAEALDGMVWQAGGATRFLERGEDAAAERALARVFDFARTAAAKMKELQNSRMHGPAVNRPEPQREHDVGVVETTPMSLPAREEGAETRSSDSVAERIEKGVVATTPAMEDVATSSSIAGQAEGAA